MNDVLVCPPDLSDISIPLQLAEPDENIGESVSKSVKRLKKQNDKSSFTDRDKQLLHKTSKAFDIEANAEKAFNGTENTAWDGTYSVYSIVSLIPNNDNVGYWLYFAID